MHLVVLVGPPAAGKMTVGRELGALTGWPLFHNHQSMEPFLGVFPFGSASFARLREETRRRVLAEAVDAGLPGLVLTRVVALDWEDDVAGFEAMLAPLVERGVRVDVAELHADQATRLDREGLPDRVTAKPSKADVAWARAHLVEMDAEHRFTTYDGERLGPGRHVRVDNGGDDPAATAREVARLLDLPVLRPPRSDERRPPR